MISVTLPQDSWRVIHGSLLEMALLWHAGISGTETEPAPDAIEDLLQRILPVISHASEWRDGATFEALVRERLDLHVPEDLLHETRALVRRTLT
jgi:hypothetical protein